MRKTLLILPLIIFCVALRAQSFLPLDEALRAPASVTHLVLRPGNNFSALQSAIRDFSTLQAVRISGLDEKALKPVFTTLANSATLMQLELDSLPGKAMPDELLKLKNLRSVVVSHSATLDYTALTTRLALLPELSELELRNNQLRAAPANLASLSMLKKLTVTGSIDLDYEGLGELVCSMPQLRTLNLEIVDLQDLPKSLSKASGLADLQIDFARYNDVYLSGKDRSTLNTSSDALALSRPNLVPLPVSLRVEGTPLTAEERTFLSNRLMPAKENATADALRPLDKKRRIVNPPIPGANVPKAVYSVDATRGDTVYYASGTCIMIPPGAFVDSSGNPLSGKVTLDYREFRDAIDFFVSGIPMTYDSGATHFTFESAGMFEINASVNGKEVQLAPGKKIDMRFVSTDSTGNWNFYRLNDSTNVAGGPRPGWETIGTAPRDNTRNPDQKSTAWKKLSIDSDPAYLAAIPPDTTGFESRFNDFNYYYTRERIGFSKGVVVTRTKHGVRKAVSLVNLRMHQLSDQQNTYFTLQHLAQAHPELAAFSYVVFEADQKMSASDFNTLYGPDANISDIRISKTDDGVVLRLKGTDEMLDVTAKMMRIDRHSSKPVALNEVEAEKVLSTYNSKISFRRKQFDQTQDRLWNHYAHICEILHRDSIRAWMKVRKYMTASEKEMDYREWMAYSKAMRVGTQTPGLLRSLQVDGFYVYNCDHPGARGVTRPALARYTDTKGKTEAPISSYVADRKQNAIYTYQPGKEFTRLRVKPFHYSALFVDYKDQIGYLSGNEFRNRTRFHFIPGKVKLHLVDKKEITYGDLRELTKLYTTSSKKSSLSILQQKKK